MTFTLTPDSSSNLTKMSAPPPSIIILTVISIVITIPIIVLSVVNYGMLSIWLNSTVAVLVLLYHTMFLVVILIYRKSFSSASVDIALKQRTGGADDDESSEHFDKPSSKPPSIAFSNWNIAALVFLFAANLIAFSTMTNVTTLGSVLGTLPAERLGSHKWNIKIQMAQTIIHGCQLLIIGILLLISAWGRRCIILEEENRLQEAQYVV